MFSKNWKNNYICGTLKTPITNITFCLHLITTVVTIEFDLEEEEKLPWHPWTRSKDIRVRTLMNPLFVAMENNPKLEWGGDAMNMCRKKNKNKHLCWTYTSAMLVKCEQCKGFLLGKILGFFLKVCGESLKFYGGKPWSLT